MFVCHRMAGFSTSVFERGETYELINDYVRACGSCTVWGDVLAASRRARLLTTRMSRSVHMWRVSMACPYVHSLTIRATVKSKICSLSHAHVEMSIDFSRFKQLKIQKKYLIFLRLPYFQQSQTLFQVTNPLN